MTKIHRVVVRGHFDGLDENMRGRLLAEAGEHEIYRSAFTADGTFTYDDRLVAFNVRYEIRVPDDDDTGDPEAAVVDLAIDRTTRWLTSVGIGHKHLRATATDMTSAWR